MEQGILAANESFYTAFQQSDLERLARLWSQRVNVTCIHPGAPPLSGYTAVLESWRQVFKGLATANVVCRNPSVRYLDRVAVVTCVEVLDHARFASTNVFVQEDGEWHMVHHQASQIERIHAARIGSEAN